MTSRSRILINAAALLQHYSSQYTLQPGTHNSRLEITWNPWVRHELDKDSEMFILVPWRSTHALRLLGFVLVGFLKLQVEFNAKRKTFTAHVDNYRYYATNDIVESASI